MLRKRSIEFNKKKLWKMWNWKKHIWKLCIYPLDLIYLHFYIHHIFIPIDQNEIQNQCQNRSFDAKRNKITSFVPRYLTITYHFATPIITIILFLVHALCLLCYILKFILKMEHVKPQKSRQAKSKGNPSIYLYTYIYVFVCHALIRKQYSPLHISKCIFTGARIKAIHI